MSNSKIKVIGYTQKIVYDNGIEYRNFNPDLVGLQIASRGGSPLLTFGNFSVTTNLEPKSDKFFITNKFSNFYTLNTLSTTLQNSSTIINDNEKAYLNLDKRKLNYYALFGSLSEFIRVGLENIITNWPASLYLQPNNIDQNGNPTTNFTIQDYTYDNVNQTATFRVDTNAITNNFNLNYTNNTNQTNTLKNLTLNYRSYVVNFTGDTEYDIIGFTGATNNFNSNVYIKVSGDPFFGLLPNSYPVYHIKPNKIKRDEFFNALPEFEAYLLNRNIIPLYTAEFKYPIKTDNGIILYFTDSLTWPVIDGYNIEFNSEEYIAYATRLLDLAKNNDLNDSNLMNRFLVAESITSFDTTPIYTDNEYDETGQKINKTLQIYGASFDKINNYITGIKYANTVTYNKYDNTPDIYVKNIARILGWDLIQSVIENDLLLNYVNASQSTFSGQSVGMTPVEYDIELWRRIILNTPWIWKSKGARKSIEFFLNFIGTPTGLITFNEHIYKASAPINIDLFLQVLSKNNLDTNLSLYPIDENGYPKPLPDTDFMYFQNNGLWYRETGGSGSTIDILTGNNPHLGPYDGGSKYINQFRCLIPNFEPTFLSSVTITENVINLYENYEDGTFDNNALTATTVNTVDIFDEFGSQIEDCVIFTQSIIQDPNYDLNLTECGCKDIGPDNVLQLCLEKNPNPSDNEIITCPDLASPPSSDNNGFYVFNYFQRDISGNYFKDNANNFVFYKSNYTTPECCKLNNGTPVLYKEYKNNITVNTGYYCCDNTGKCGCIIACKWVAQTTPFSFGQPDPTQSVRKFLQFTTENGTSAIVTPDGCNCISPYTIAVPNIQDPYTGQVGYACQLTEKGETDLALGTFGEIYKTYFNRSTGKINCFTTTGCRTNNTDSLIPC
jgi:hypothetical protein